VDHRGEIPIADRGVDYALIERTTKANPSRIATFHLLQPTAASNNDAMTQAPLAWFSLWLRLKVHSILGLMTSLLVLEHPKFFHLLITWKTHLLN
jgi:hypothetical protein